MRHKRIYLAVLLALFAAVSCRQQEIVPVEKPAAPKVEYSPAGGELELFVGEDATFEAKILEGTSLKTAWYVDGVKVSSTPSVNWVFNELGTVTLRFEATNELGTETRDFTVTVKGIPLEVSFTAEGDELAAVVGTALQVGAEVTGGDKGTVHSWTLDGAPAGDGISVSLNFGEEDTGAHTLTYNGQNIDGMTATKTWTVNVTDLPLEFSFTPAEEELSRMEEKTVNFTAGIIHGSKGVSYSWKVDGTEVSTAASYTHDCTAQGTFSISFNATNAAGENVSRTWTLLVTEKTDTGYIYLDAEGKDSVPAFVSGNTASEGSCVKLVDNPYPTSVNNASKVFIDDLRPTTWANSGYVQIMLNQLPTTERSEYTRIRVKVYLGASAYVPYMYVPLANKSSLPAKINGTDFYPSASSQANWNSLVRTDDWNILEYDIMTGNYGFTEPKTLADLDQIQFRFTVLWGNGSAPAAASDTNARVVWFDDVELLP